MRVFRLIDKRTKRCLLPHVGAAERTMPRFLGLMGRPGLSPDTGLYFPRCSSIHMFFMRFAIDAVYVDAELKVRKIVHGLKPWRLSWCPGAFGVLETQAGWAQKTGLTVGTELALEERAEREE